MIGAVAPQKRGEIPDADRDRILAAQQADAAAHEAFVQAVVDALKHGASVREVATLTGLSPRTVFAWGHANGWPTAAQKKARDEIAAANAAYRQRVEQVRSRLEREQNKP